MRKRKVIDIAREVIRIESEAVAVLGDRIDEKFEAVVKQIIECKGRLIVCGIGKSGLISKKIASTSPPLVHPHSLYTQVKLFTVIWA